MKGISISKRKATRNPTLLGKIVKRILKSNPDATQNEVIEEIINDPNRFGVAAIDVEGGLISIEDDSKGKKNILIVQRSFKTIGNILTKIRKF